MDSGDTLGAVALAMLAAMFVGALIALVVICYRRHALFKSPHHILHDSFIKPEVMLIPDSVCTGTGEAPLELQDVKLAPQIDKILNDAQWVDDATGLIPHCLAILKLCHLITERMVASTLTPLPNYQLNQIIQASRRVSPRLDDVARAMYPPLDPRLLEARCAALTLTLALLAAHTHPPTTPQGAAEPTVAHRDIAEALAEMDRHVQVLRSAAECHEMCHELLPDEGARGLEASEC